MILPYSGQSISEASLRSRIGGWLAALAPLPKKLLVVAPDITRIHSYGGQIVSEIWRRMKNRCQVDILVALGTHLPMTAEELAKMFGDIPVDRFRQHDWRGGVKKIGRVPPSVVEELSEGRLHYGIDVEVNRLLLDPSYDAIVSVGQVVPHEVAGMSNHSKNIFVGCGGKDFIDKSHFLGAVYGIERIMGQADTPVRRLFRYAEQQFLNVLPVQYVLTVTGAEAGENALKGLFIGSGDEPFRQAAALSYELNVIPTRGFRKAVVYLDPGEYRTAWLGDKAIYRTRMAIEDGGELLILAPGVQQFGEDGEIDRLIRKYGYRGTGKTLACLRDNPELEENLSVAASLLHGASDGRFRITYAVNHLSREEVEGVGFCYASAEEAMVRYNPAVLEDGFNVLSDGEEIFFVSNPALGLWKKV